MKLRRRLTTRVGLAAIRHGIRPPGLSSLGRYAELLDLSTTLNDAAVDCVIDVGANIGQFGSDLRGIGYRGWIVSFEPSAAEYEQLQQLRDDRWLTYPHALSSEDGMREFFVDRHSVNNSFYRLKDTPDVQAVSVTSRRLDALMPEILASTKARRVFLKCDTQGHDLEVVEGAGRYREQFVGLMSEVSVRPIYDGMPHYLDSLKQYEAYGFRLKSLHVVGANESGAVVEYNCIMVRDETIGVGLATGSAEASAPGKPGGAPLSPRDA